jgi:DNA-binding IclR family transcriptional regulator
MTSPPPTRGTDAAGARPETEVKSAARTVELLELLAAEPQPLTLTEIAARSGLPVSSLHQLLRTLVSRGWLATTTHGTGYTIGVRALLTGMSFIERDPVVQAARPVLNLLRSELGETVHLARLDGARVVYLASRESEHQLRTVSRVGQSLSAHATGLGKATLSALSDEQIRMLFPPKLEKLTPNTIDTLDELLRQVGESRARGWAREAEENTFGSGCIAAVIPRIPGPYAISCSVPLTRLDEARAVEIAQAMMAAARDIGSALGPLAFA